MSANKSAFRRKTILFRVTLKRSLYDWNNDVIDEYMYTYGKESLKVQIPVANVSCEFNW